MKYKVSATYVFEVEADEPEWAQEEIDIKCLRMHVYNLNGTPIFPSWDVEAVEHTLAPDGAKALPKCECGGKYFHKDCKLVYSTRPAGKA